MKTGGCFVVAITLTVTGLAQAQTRFQSNSAGGANQVCLHRTADGRCLHWADGGPTPDQQRPTPPPPTSTSGCVVNPATGASQVCYHVTADGRCVHFGGRCN